MWLSLSLFGFYTFGSHHNSIKLWICCFLLRNKWKHKTKNFVLSSLQLWCFYVLSQKKKETYLWRKSHAAVLVIPHCGFLFIKFLIQTFRTLESATDHKPPLSYGKQCGSLRNSLPLTLKFLGFQDTDSDDSSHRLCLAG